MEASLVVEANHAAIGMLYAVYSRRVACGMKRRLLRAGGLGANSFTDVNHVDVGMLLALCCRLSAIDIVFGLFRASTM